MYPNRRIDPSLWKKIMYDYGTLRMEGYQSACILYVLATYKVTISDLSSEDDDFYQVLDKYERTLQKSTLTKLLIELSFVDDDQCGRQCLERWVQFYNESSVDLVADMIRTGHAHKLLVLEQQVS